MIFLYACHYLTLCVTLCQSWQILFLEKMWHCGKWIIQYMFESMWCTCKSDHQMRGVYVHIGGHIHFPCRYHCDRYLIQKWKSINWNSLHMCKQHVSIAEMHESAMQSSMNQWVIMPYHNECWRWVQKYRRWRVSTADIHGSKFHVHSHRHVSGHNWAMHGWWKALYCEWINQAHTDFQAYGSPKSMTCRRFLWSVWHQLNEMQKWMHCKTCYSHQEQCCNEVDRMWKRIITMKCGDRPMH
jgi:hypothetical protein